MSGFGRIFKPAPHLRSWTLVLGLCFAMAASHANAQSDVHQHFGKVHFPVACNIAVQDEFNLALAMLHTFSFPAAAEAFMAIAQKDSDCAMAHWGIAATATKIENDCQVVTAWIAYKHGRRDEALRMLRAAADHEDSTEWDPVMPGHIISARQNLGEMLLDANDPTQALQAFEAALKTEPFRLW